MAPDVNGRNTDMEPRWEGARYRRRLVGATALLFAAKSADVEVMRLLLANGADPKINTGVNITPLMAAAGIAWASNQDKASEADVLEAVKLLVEGQGLDVNFVADTGETAMHAAAYRGANSVVQYLFDRGAKLDVIDKSGRRRSPSPMAWNTAIRSPRNRTRPCCCASSAPRTFRAPACAPT
jgi:ankyrin repeat protein